jgi:hypothetical protein
MRRYYGSPFIPMEFHNPLITQRPVALNTGGYYGQDKRVSVKKAVFTGFINLQLINICGMLY